MKFLRELIKFVRGGGGAGNEIISSIASLIAIYGYNTSIGRLRFPLHSLIVGPKIHSSAELAATDGDSRKLVSLRSLFEPRIYV